MLNAEQSQLDQQILEILQSEEIPVSGGLEWTPVPFHGEWGISTSFFKTAAQEARSGKKIKVSERAGELADLVAGQLEAGDSFSRVEAVNGYLNLYYKTGKFGQMVVNRVLDEGPDFGQGASTGKKIMVEFSQPNTHKAFHVGHLRSAILGDAVCRILEFAGHQVVRVNYYGDIGLHVIKWLWNYQKYHAGEKPPEQTTKWMGELYAEANRRLAGNPDLESEIRELYTRWDQRDPDVVHLWEETRSWSVAGFEQLYDVLGIHFDRFYANSEVEIPGKEMVRDLIEQEIAEDLRPDDAVIVRIDEQLGLKKEKYRVLVVQIGRAS
jgi:arginyl-tRNA synthetase